MKRPTKKGGAYAGLQSPIELGDQRRGMDYTGLPSPVAMNNMNYGTPRHDTERMVHDHDESFVDDFESVFSRHCCKIKWWQVIAITCISIVGLLTLAAFSWDIALQVTKAGDGVVTDVNNIKERIVNINVNNNDETTFDRSIIVEDITYTNQLIIGTAPSKKRVVQIPSGKSATYEDFYVTEGSTMQLWNQTSQNYFSASDAIVATTEETYALSTAITNLLTLVADLTARVESNEAQIEVLNAAVAGLSTQLALRVQFMGDWSSVTSYTVNSMVFYNTSYWIALVANTASLPSYSNTQWTGWAM